MLFVVENTVEIVFERLFGTQNGRLVRAARRKEIGRGLRRVRHLERRRIRQQEHIVRAALFHLAFALLFEKTYDGQIHAAVGDLFAERGLRRAEQPLRRVWPDHTDLLLREHVRVAEKAPPIHLFVHERRIALADPRDRGALGLLVADLQGSVPRRDRRAHAGKQIPVVGEIGIHLFHRDRAARLVHDRDIDICRAEIAPLRNLTVQIAVHQAHEDDDGGHADDDAEHGEGGAHLVAPDAL